MRTLFRYLTPAWLVIAGALIATPSFAESAADVDGKVTSALDKLYQSVPEAKKFAENAKGILVFPEVLKAGLIVGAQGGNGALRVDGKTKGYYQTASLSAGLQAGAQKFGYALFFQTDEALAFLDRSGGWEIGTGPNITVVDRGAATSLTSTTLKDDIYVFFFDQKGLMAGIGLEGSRIAKWTPEQ
jgi:lipid-binding SYLF domain-containing protein